MFSAAWRADVSPALTLWSLSDVTLVSSAYAIDEAERNLDSADRRARLYRLLRQIEIVDEPPARLSLYIPVHHHSVPMTYVWCLTAGVRAGILTPC